MRHLSTVDLEVEQVSGVTVVHFPEEVDVVNAAAIRERVLRLLNSGVTEMLLDLTGTRFLDSAGIHIIVRAHGRSTALRVPLSVAIPEQGNVRRVFDLAGLPRLVPTTVGLPRRLGAVAPRSCSTAGVRGRGRKPRR
ncbi:STAS domain-containing protein [Actinoallomurus rhizosphaericola]|uniref:STAS domain-containing protein n=1 Tax=Actinoallomurus rhizosphaericola TaxID=2952536 RepID=UPI0020928D61|nr:STAS domain-containing protein [Actinoallomurus rhizosphaericola]MCO5997364.1 STAS domain-containing protein [Actinoallomurus rhizosphaericola]